MRDRPRRSARFTPTIHDLLCASSSAHLSLTRLKVNGTPMDALIDTGAQVSTMTQELCRKLGLSSWVRNSCRAIRSVTGNVVKGIGEVYAPIQFEPDVTCTAFFLILANCPYDLIIGVDNLKKFGHVGFEYTSGRLRLCFNPPQARTLRGLDVLMTDNWHTSKPLAILHADLIFPPMTDSKFIVPCSEFGGGVTVLFEPGPLHEDLILSRSVNRAKGHFGCRVVNISENHVVVYKGTPLGVLEALPAEVVMDQCTLDPAALAPQGTPLEDVVSKVDLSKSVLIEKEKHDLKNFLYTKSKAFATHEYDLGRIKGLSGRVCDTGDALPIKKAPYRLPVFQREPLDTEIQRMLQAGLIEPGNQSAWASPVLLVKKKEGAWRLCTDYRAINAATKKLCHPLPHQDSVREMLSGQGLYTTIDLQKAYWQLELDSEEDRDRSAFVTYNNVWRYRCLPFGMTNAPSVFQRAVSVILGNLLWVECQCFLDDILIFSPPNYAEHKRRIGNVLDKFIQYGVKINPAKSVWARAEVQYLGYVFTSVGSKPAPGLVEKIQKFPSPHDLPSLRRALGMLNFYRAYISSYSEKAQPLIDLLKKDRAFTWSKECEEAFTYLKAKLVEFPVLRFPDFSLPIFLHTDSSGYALGAHLCQ